ncbi:MAG: putative metal-binding motif-containing protein, partial [Myxococcota bacterium]|nr:putative metal-binding motif-containing protein [Myxococcota bacterium]
MPGLMPGLALGGLWVCLWALVETLIGGTLTAWPAVVAILLPSGFAGGVAGASLPATWSGGIRRYTVPSLVVGAMALWATAYVSFYFLLTHSFDLLEEIAAIFSTVVLGAGALGAVMVWAGSRRDERPADRWAAGLPLAGAVFTALIASRVTSRVIGFEIWTLGIAAISALLAAHALMILSPPTLLEERRNHVAGVAGFMTLLLAAGLALYSSDAGTRWSTWRGVPLTRSLASTFANITDADVDGVSGSLGHPDCDDSLPHVYPGARELPGNGRDDTCNGQDVSAETVRELWTTGVRAPTPSPEGEPQN